MHVYNYYNYNSRWLKCCNKATGNADPIYPETDDRINITSIEYSSVLRIDTTNITDDEMMKYMGQYICKADNGYSTDLKEALLSSFVIAELPMG